MVDAPDFLVRFTIHMLSKADPIDSGWMAIDSIDRIAIGQFVLMTNTCPQINLTFYDTLSTGL